MNIKQINTAIMQSDLTNEELNSIGDAIRFARAQLVVRNKMLLTKGSSVKFKHNKTGEIIFGSVEKVNRKFIIVNQSGLYRSWKVPANMLEVL